MDNAEIDPNSGMFTALKRLAARLFGRLPPASGPFEDPYAGVREPRRRGPSDRSSAVAVAEPLPEHVVEVRARRESENRLASQRNDSATAE